MLLASRLVFYCTAEVVCDMFHWLQHLFLEVDFVELPLPFIWQVVGGGAVYDNFFWKWDFFPKKRCHGITSVQHLAGGGGVIVWRGLARL